MGEEEGDDLAGDGAEIAVAADAGDPTVNLMPAIVDAVKAYATVGEIVASLEAAFGRWTETPSI